MHFRVGGCYAEDEKSREWRLRRMVALRLWGVVLREVQASVRPQTIAPQRANKGSR